VVYETLYGAGSAYGRSPSGLGDSDAVRAVTQEDIVGFHQGWIRPDNARIFVTSDQPLAEVLPAIEAHLGTWAAPSVSRGTKPSEFQVQAARPRIILIDLPQSPQSLILGGQVLNQTGRDDLLVLDAAMEVLGTSFSSRINTDLRETRGWSYGARSSVIALEGRSVYLVRAPVQSDRTGESIASLMAVHQAFLGSDGVSSEELTRTTESSSRRLAGRLETTAAVLANLRSSALFGWPDDYWVRAGARYRALTSETMNQAAHQSIDPSQFVWVVVGDASVVRPQLEALRLPVEIQSAQ
jgi:predicted Zn-dependent peptidase